jgi:hypothetical protein
MHNDLNFPLPVTAEIAIRKGNAMPDNQQVTLHFVHPTDSTQVLTATVGSASTPDYLIKELVNTRTGKELADRMTLATAGVATDTTLNLLHSVTGAERGASTR